MAVLQLSLFELAVANPEALYQQNHCGIYRADFSGKEWIDISEGLPSRFGFALAVPAAEKQTLFTIPVDSPENRFVPKESCAWAAAAMAENPGSSSPKVCRNPTRMCSFCVKR